MDIPKTLLSKLRSFVCFGLANDDHEAGPRVLDIVESHVFVNV